MRVIYFGMQFPPEIVNKAYAHFELNVKSPKTRESVSNMPKTEGTKRFEEFN